MDNTAVRGDRSVSDDLAVHHRFREPQVYSVQCFQFDNRAGARILIPSATSFNVPGKRSEYLVAPIQGPDQHKTLTVSVRDQWVVEIGRIW